MPIEPLEPRIAPASFTVTTLADSGPGSLRQALLSANSTAGADTITFTVAGTIAVVSALPIISEQLTLDASTAPGFTGLPVVGLNGTNAGQAIGLDVTGGAIVKSLAIGGFAIAGLAFDAATGVNSAVDSFFGTNIPGSLAIPNGSGLIIFNTPNVTVIHCLISGNTNDGLAIIGAASLGNTISRSGIGIDVSGLSDLGNGGAGIFLGDAPGNFIGIANTTNNTISGNGGAGIEVSGAGAAHNAIRANVIGSDATFATAIPNDGDGIFLHNGASDTTIGGLENAARNLISGNRGNGLRIEDATLSTVRNNSIGLNFAGNAARPNGLSGVAILGTSRDNLIGGDGGQNATNAISGNTGAGVRLAGTATHNIVAGNLLGIAATSPLAIANAAGIVIEEHAAQNTIGGALAFRNFISGNTGDGILITSDGAGQIVQGNIIGGFTNTMVLPNGGDGIHLENTAGNLIGGVATQRNFIVGNLGAGIGLVGANGNTITANYIGVSGTGSNAQGNQRSGIGLTDSADNVIGASGGNGNILSGNTGAGIFLAGSGTHGNRVAENAIGTNPEAAFALPNDFGIVGRQSGANTIEFNVISGNRFDGIALLGSDGFIIRANRIGLNLGGAAAIANGGNGLLLDQSSGTQIGGAALADANAFAGNGGAGIAIFGGGGNAIARNFIGLNGAVTAALSNREGIHIEGSGNTIGGAGDLGNFISGNRGAGIVIVGGGHRISGNLIGAVITGQPIPNGGSGVEITGSGNVVGKDQANLIAFNGGAGILIHTGAAGGGSGGNELRGNVFVANGGPGIDLEPGGATANDPGDFDTGANGLQNFPVLTGASVSGGQVSIAGALNSTANTAFTIDFYSNDLGGQASVLLGSASVMTDGSGNAAIASSFAAPPAGRRIVALATNEVTHDTSEISAAITPSTDTPGIRISDARANETDASIVFTVTLDAPGNRDVTVQFSSADGTARAGSDYTAASGALSFAAGETSKTITVPLLNDALVEPVEIFTLNLSAPTGGGVLADANGDGAIVSNDDTTLHINRKGTIAKWRDVDGDFVTLTATTGLLDAGDFVFEARGTLGGEQLVALHLGDDFARGVGLTFSAKRNAAAPSADGLVHVGWLDADGLDLGSVSISGDLGRILAGDTDATTRAIKQLTAGSLGVFGASTQAADGDTVSVFLGKAKSVAITGFVAGSLIFRGGEGTPALGRVGRITIGGDLLGGDEAYSGSIVASGSIGSITIGGTLHGGGFGGTGIFSGGTIGTLNIGALLGASAVFPVVIAAQGFTDPTALTALAIGSLTVAGNVENADIRAGYSVLGEATTHSVAIGKVKVKRDWIASSLVAGIEPGSDGYYGDATDTIIAAGNAIASSIAKIVIRGKILGTPDATSTTDHFAFTATKIGAFTLATTPIALSADGRDDVGVGTGGDVRIREV